MIRRLKRNLPRLLIAVACMTVAIAVTPGRSAADDTTQPSADSGSTPDFSASMLSLHMTDATIDAVLAEIQGLSENSVHFLNPPYSNLPAPAPLSIDVAWQPFWKIVADICDQRHLGISVASNGALTLVSPQYNSLTPTPARDTSGPALLMAQSVDRQVDLTADGKGADYCVVRMTGLIEPRFKALYYENVTAPTTAVDENGVSLVPGADVPLDDPGSQPDPKSDDYHIQMLACRQPPFGFGNQPPIIHCALRIYVPPNAARRIGRLAGTFKFWNAAKTAVVTMQREDFTGTERAFTLDGGLTLHLDRQMGGAKITSVVVTLQHAGRTDAQWTQDVRFFGFALVSMTDDTGKTSDMASNSQNWNSTKHTWFFSTGDATLKEVTITIPTSVREIDVPFSFTDLPLP